ncbi:MAG: NAD(P)-dependent alcohol dehydrogenase [Caulobacteraceae bacterium]
MRITAAVSRASGAPLSIEPLELDDPREDEVLVEVAACGVCHTDLTMRDMDQLTPKPVVLGHEGAGVVLAVGRAVRDVEPGDHVVMSYDYCGACHCCRTQAPFYCDDALPMNFGGLRPDGSARSRGVDGPVGGSIFGQSAFATHALCTERNLVKVSRDLPMETLGPLGCGVETGAGAVMNVLRPRPEDTLAVFGVGGVGMSAVMAAAALGVSRIIAVDVNPERLALARELGAHDIVDARDGRSAEALLDLTSGGVDHALDATANAKATEAAIAVLAPRGSLCLTAASRERISLNARHMMLGGRRLMGAVQGEAISKTFIPKLIALHLQGRFPFDRLLTPYPLAQINQALADAETGAVLKPLIRMSSPSVTAT